MTQMLAVEFRSLKEHPAGRLKVLKGVGGLRAREALHPSGLEAFSASSRGGFFLLQGGAARSGREEGGARGEKCAGGTLHVSFRAAN